MQVSLVRSCAAAVQHCVLPCSLPACLPAVCTIIAVHDTQAFSSWRGWRAAWSTFSSTIA
jgi:hypothetical protein